MKDYKYVYLIGVGGIGMSALARWFNAQSVQVFGYDKTSTSLTDQLVQEGIRIHFDDQVEAIPEAIRDHKDQTLVIYTPAIAAQNQVLSHLRGNHYAVFKRAEVLAMLTKHHRTIAVAGTHGKTTTTTLLSHLIYSAGKNMVGFLGGIARGYASNLIMNGTPQEDTIMVLEADEFDRSFLHTQPHLAIVTTADPDHLDIYETKQSFEDAFKDFIALVPPGGKAIVHQKVAQQLQLAKDTPHLVRYAIDNAPVSAANINIKEGDFCFDYVSDEVTIKQLQLALPGHYNVENALAAITVCLNLGIAPEDIRKGLASFQGIERRFDYVIRTEDLVFIDDFAHHPVEIDALLKAIRTLYPTKKLTAIFRPHLYSRTRDFERGFAQSLDQADQVLLLDIYPARETPIEGVTSACIFEHMALGQKMMCTQETLLDTLAQQSALEVVALIGAGGVAQLIPSIKDFLLKYQRK